MILACGRCLVLISAPHIYQVHDPSRPFECDDCTYRFDTAGDLVQHRARVHAEHVRSKHPSATTASTAATRKEPNDGAAAASQVSLEPRTRGVAGRGAAASSKQLICHDCRYFARSQSTLIAHMRTHSGDKPFSCGECSYRCARADSLSRHTAVS